MILQDETVLGVQEVAAIEEVLDAQGWDVRVVYPSRSSFSYLNQHLCGASLCFAAGGVSAENLYWMLPRNCTIWE